jgi:hypothetical protein
VQQNPSPPTGDDSTVEGFLYKKMRWTKAWKKRWFMFDGALLYYWPPDARARDPPRGVYSFGPDASPASHPHDDGAGSATGYTYEFSVSGFNLADRHGNTLELAAPSGAERLAWLRSLGRMCALKRAHASAGAEEVIVESRVWRQSRFLRRFSARHARLLPSGELVLYHRGSGNGSSHGSQDALFLVSPRTTVKPLLQSGRPFAFRVDRLRAAGAPMDEDAPALVLAAASSDSMEEWTRLIARMADVKAETQGRALINMLLRIRDDERAERLAEIGHFGASIAEVERVRVGPGEESPQGVRCRFAYREPVPAVLARLGFLLRAATASDSEFARACEAAGATGRELSEAERGSGALGLRAEGVFRLSADDVELKARMREIDGLAGSDRALSRFECGNALLSAALMKAFLRQMPEPLLETVPRGLMAQADTAKAEEAEAGDGPGSGACVCSRVVSTVPEPQRSALLFVLDVLADAEAHRECSLMTAQNLGVVMAPNLLRPPTAEDMANPVEAMATMARGNTMLASLILWRARTRRS